MAKKQACCTLTLHRRCCSLCAGTASSCLWPCCLRWQLVVPTFHAGPAQAVLALRSGSLGCKEMRSLSASAVLENP